MKIRAVAVLVALSWATCMAADDAGRREASDPFAGRGYQILHTKAYLPADFDQETFDQLWQSWEEPLRSQAEKASPTERRKLAFSRYGLTTAPGDESGKPQQYVVDARGNWTMTCLACHQGKIDRKSVV